MTTSTPATSTPLPDDVPALHLQNLQFRWSNQHHQLDTIHISDWQIKQGQHVLLYGRSGTGKSTLLNLISGILLPQQGSIRINNIDITQLSQHQRDRFRAQHLGVIFQQFNLLPYLSIADNIQLSQVFSKAPNDLQRIHELCHSLGLNTELLQQSANQLSVGQQQRVAVARALYHCPSLVIADEPTSALDSETRDEFIQLLLQQSQQNNSTILFVSHDKSLASHFDATIDLSSINHHQSMVSGE